MNKKIITTLLMGLMATMSVQADLSSVDDSIKSNKANASNSSSNNGEKSGFTKDVQVIGTEKQFNNRHYTARDFSTWLSIYHTAQALSKFVELYNDGVIGKYGVINSLAYFDDYENYYSTDEVVTIKQLKTSFSHVYKGQDLIEDLISIGILTEDAYLADVSLNAISIKDVDFNALGDKMQNLELDLDRPQLVKELKRDLIRLFKARSTTTVVTTHESTTYQSREDGLWDNIKGNFLGNLAGSVLFRDKVREKRTESAYKPAVNSYSHYPGVQLGYAPYPGFKNISGRTTLMGDKTLNTLGVSTSESDDDTTLISAKYQLNRALSSSASGLANGKITVAYKNISDDNDDELSWGSVDLGFGAEGTQGSLGFNVGLSYFDSTDDNTYLGFNFGTEAEILFRPIAVYGSYTSRGNYNFIDDKSVWRINEFELGLRKYIYRVNVDVGYENIYTETGSIHSGFKWGLGFNF